MSANQWPACARTSTEVDSSHALWGTFSNLMSTSPKRRHGGLDGLRGFAALLVFGVHMWIYQLPNTLTLKRDWWGEALLFEARVAFVMFFVLSGYLLYRPFARAALGESAPESIRAYLVRRAARILPAYYLALLGALVLVGSAGAVEGRRMIESGEIPLFFLFAQNYSADTLLRLNAATWTLVVEVAFYLLLPIVALFALRRCYGSARAQLALLLALVGIGVTWNLVGYAAGWGAVASHAPPSFLPYFACGMMVALLVERVRAGHLRALDGRATVVLTAAAVTTLVANGYWHATDHSPDGFLIEVFADLPAALAFAAIVAAIVIGTGAGLRWLSCRPLSWFGEISYGFYLWHVPLMVWARGHGLLDGGILLDVALVLPVAVALGAASWYALERPLMRRAEGLRRKRTDDEEAAISATRHGRSRWRTPAHTEPPPASLSARGAASPR
jgi:peptidoglycan/LPS O-acetylase OafA/YrhL